MQGAWVLFTPGGRAARPSLGSRSGAFDSAAPTGRYRPVGAVAYLLAAGG
jgi:hypothetical protein